MTQSTTPNSSGQKIVIDVNDESFYKGFETATASCNEQRSAGFFHNYHVQEAMYNYVPLVVILIIYTLLCRRTGKINEVMRDRQKQALDCMVEARVEAREMSKETNRLLMEISQKLGAI